MPPDSIVDGAIIDGARRRRRHPPPVRRAQAFKTKDVAASLSGNAVIVKKITLPVMTEAELAESIYWEAEQYIPFDIQDVNLDYQILDRRHRRRRARARWTCCSSPRRRRRSPTTPASSRRPAASPVVVDVDAFALQNAYEVNYGIEPGAVVVLLNAGASAININILSGDQSVFTRDISIGGNAYTEARPEGTEPAVRAGRAAEDAACRSTASTFDDARPVLRAVTENVMLEIQKTFDFFKATASSDRIDRIMLSGGASRVEGFTEMLERALRGAGRGVRSVQARSRSTPKKFGVATRPSVAPTAAVAVGLALRRAGDR